jgi:predicted Rossmann fold nucleotide-binding protein DprA/Smf involved in DNA uptake
MDVRDYLGDDGHVVLALCSSVGMPQSGAPDRPDPFTLSEWNRLAAQIESSGLDSSAALRGLPAGHLSKELAIPAEQAERIVRLLDRSARLALELESLLSRGIWAVTRLDRMYPSRMLDTLKQQAPSVLFGAGDARLLQRPAVAVVGSRDIDEAGAAFAREIGRKAAEAKLAVVSGGARGTDRIAMDGALEADGVAIGALADSLESTIRKADVRELILDERLALVTPYAPTAGFSVGAAMGRNKLIYGLAEYAVVVSSDFQTGGTWAGAAEALKAQWRPVFVRDGANVPKGNRELLKLGARPLSESDLANTDDLAGLLRQQGLVKTPKDDLFPSV